jgi:hypothetical protein
MVRKVVFLAKNYFIRIFTLSHADTLALRSLYPIEQPSPSGEGGISSRRSTGDWF